MTEFSVLTFNLWHDLQDREARAKVFIELVKQTKPDIICLQEYTPAAGLYIPLTELGYIKPMLVSEDSTIELYTLNINHGIRIVRTKYSAFQVEPCGIQKLPETKMNRNMMYFTIACNNSNQLFTTICTCHFDSEFGKHNIIKHGQYKYAENLLRGIYTGTNTKSNIILCGDFSVGGVEDGLELSKIFDTNGWQDTWRVTGADPRHEITFNRETNPYNRESKHHSRLDRVLYLGESIKCVEHRVIAGFVDKATGAKYVASDHYGVLAKFKVLTSPPTSNDNVNLNKVETSEKPAPFKIETQGEVFEFGFIEGTNKVAFPNRQYLAEDFGRRNNREIQAKKLNELRDARLRDVGKMFENVPHKIGDKLT